MFSAIRHFWRTGEGLHPTGVAGPAASLAIDELEAETYDRFDETAILAGSQAMMEAISPKRVRLEIARKQAIGILASSDDGLLEEKRVRAAMQTSVPGSLISAIDNAMRESKHQRRSSVIAWADVIQKSRRFGISRSSLVELRGFKSEVQRPSFV